MKSLFALALLSLSSFSYALSTSVTLEVKTVPAINDEFCIVQILQPEVEGYNYTYSGNARQGETLLDYLSYDPYWVSVATKSIKIKSIIKNLKTNETMSMTRVVSAKVSFVKADGMSDHSALEVREFLPFAEEVNAVFLGVPGAINDVANGVLSSWNTAVSNIRAKANSYKVKRATVLTDSKVIQGLNIMGNAEAALLTQYACADKADAIKKVEFQKYLAKLANAMNAFK